MENMQIKDWISITAILISPILAIQVQKVIEKYREKRKRKLNLFHTLMSTRASRLSHSHVEALNMIDIEFYGRKIFGVRVQSKKSKSVTNAWKNYNDHLNNREAHAQLDSWLERGNDLLATLLFHISQALGYDFDEVQLKRDCYSPVYHGDVETQQAVIRKGMAEVFTEGKPLPLYVVNLNGEQPAEPNNEVEETVADER